MAVPGMANGIGSVPEDFISPIGGKLNTAIFGVGTVNFADRVKMTAKHTGK